MKKLYSYQSPEIDVQLLSVNDVLCAGDSVSVNIWNPELEDDIFH